MTNDDSAAVYTSPLTKATTGALLLITAIGLGACLVYAVWWLIMNWAP